VEEILKIVLNAISGGGPTSIIAILCGIIIYLGWEKKSIQKAHKESLEQLADSLSSKAKDNREDLIAVINRYQEGHINILEAINEIKVLIATMTGKL
jgi:hypothetical protein